MPHRGGHVKDEYLSDCARKGIAVKPWKGDDLLFLSLHPAVSTDQNSLHGGFPVLEGEKWSATKWIHVASFEKIHGNAGNCTDNNDKMDCPRGMHKESRVHGWDSQTCRGTVKGAVMCAKQLQTISPLSFLILGIHLQTVPDGVQILAAQCLCLLVLLPPL